MIEEKILREIETKFYYVGDNFKGGELLIEAIYGSSNSENEGDRKIYEIVNHPDEVIVVSPWSGIINLLDEDFSGNSGGKCIVLKEGYKVLNERHRELYRVYEHKGLWGNSILDKTLILQSKIGEIYYIQYPTMRGIRELMIIINNISLIGGKGEVIKEELKTPIVDDRWIEIEPSKNNIEMNIEGIKSIRIWALRGGLGKIPTIEEIKNNPSIEIEEYIKEKEVIIYYPKGSGWIVIEEIYEDIEEGNKEILMEMKEIKGAGVDRVLKVSKGIYYIGTSNEIDILEMRRVLGREDRRPPDFSTQDLINIKTKLIRV